MSFFQAAALKFVSTSATNQQSRIQWDGTRTHWETFNNTRVDLDGDFRLVGQSYNVEWYKSANALEFANNAKAIFGAGSDLSIFHNGSTSLIEDSGTGGLTIRSDIFTVQNAAGTETVAQFVQDSFVKLFHNNSQVFTTTSTGVDVTGTLTSDGLTVQSNNYLDIHDADNHVSGRLRNVSGSNNALAIEADPNNSASDSFINFKIDTSEKMRIRSTGHVEFNPVTPFSGLNNSILGSSNGYQYFMGGANGLYLADNADLSNAIGIRDVGFLDFITGGTVEKMRITSTGHVGIGTDDPNNVSGYRTLHIRGTSGSLIDMGASGTDSRIVSDTNGLGFEVTAGAHANQNIRWKAGTISGATDSHMLLNSSGNLGIGTSSPNQKLHIYSSSGNTYTKIESNANNTRSANLYWAKKSDGSTIRGYVGVTGDANKMEVATTTNDSIHFYTNNNPTNNGIFLKADGNVGIGRTSSSAKLHVVDGVSDTVIADNAVVKIDGTGGDGLAFGNTQSSPFSSWMQAGYLADGYSPAFNNGYPILINPIGGNVMIGSNVPNSYLHIDKRTTSTVSGRSQFQIRADGSGARGQRIKRITYCYRPLYNQYTYHRIILGGGVYGAGQTIRYRVTFTTGHAAGHGFVEGVLSVYAHHSTTKMHLTGHTKYVRHYSNGSYYGWTSNPDVDFFFSNDTNSNACVIMRVQGHGNHNGGTYDLIADHHIDLEIHGSDHSANTEMLLIGHSAPGDMGTVFSSSTLN